MDTFEGKPYIIRRSRGYAPLPVMTSCSDKGQTLAIGGELKNTFCIRKGVLVEGQLLPFLIDFDLSVYQTPPILYFAIKCTEYAECDSLFPQNTLLYPYTVELVADFCAVFKCTVAAFAVNAPIDSVIIKAITTAIIFFVNFIIKPP